MMFQYGLGWQGRINQECDFVSTWYGNKSRIKARAGRDSMQKGRKEGLEMLRTK